MAWLKIESSVARNRKFLKAGPAASWLWICGIAYCQEGLTDGFIPREALPALGVLKDADRLATKLVLAGLWDACDEGGWRVHDYLEHNRSAEEVIAIRAARAAGGKHGGRPRKEPSAKPSTHNQGLTEKTLRKTSAVDVDASVVVDGSDQKKELSVQFHEDVAFVTLTGRYPSHRVTDSFVTLSAFHEQLEKNPPPAEAFDRMLDNLENQKASDEWQTPRLVPSLENWLSKGLWKRRYSDTPTVETAKTSGNRAVLQRFIDRGRPA